MLVRGRAQSMRFAAAVGSAADVSRAGTWRSISRPWVPGSGRPGRWRSGLRGQLAGQFAGLKPAAAMLPAAVWRAAVALERPALAYLSRRLGCEPIVPAALRWLPAAVAAAIPPDGEGRRPVVPGDAVGALAYLFAGAGDSSAAAAVQLEAVDADGRRVPWGRDAVKRWSVPGSDFAGGARVFVAAPGRPACGAWLCEGPLDALAVAVRERVCGVPFIEGAAGDRRRRCGGLSAGGSYQKFLGRSPWRCRATAPAWRRGEYSSAASGGSAVRSGSSGPGSAVTGRMPCGSRWRKGGCNCGRPESGTGSIGGGVRRPVGRGQAHGFGGCRLRRSTVRARARPHRPGVTWWRRCRPASSRW